jgi:L-idonate 5-dehydrogenase
MRVCVIHQAQDLRLEEHDLPSITPQAVLIRVRAGGICGSDLHYYFEGQNGDFAIREPFVPGHEVSGEVFEVGAEVTRVGPGQRVAIPSRAQLRALLCLSGRAGQSLP